MVGIIGYGTVGVFLEKMLNAGSVETVIYDKYKVDLNNPFKKEQINRCDLVFIAVPTGSDESGGCDISQVEEAVSWVEPPMCIKSTVVPGTIDKLVNQTGKQIVFSPEYTGETPFHKYKDDYHLDLVAIGGDRIVAERFLELYKLCLGPEPHYFLTDAVTAELAKYMENCFFATKVAFVAQFYLLAKQFGADFNEMREIWVADTRVGRSHSTVIGCPGFGGRCLPKDLSAIIEAAKKTGQAPLLEAVQTFNTVLRQSEKISCGVASHKMNRELEKDGFMRVRQSQDND